MCATPLGVVFLSLDPISWAKSSTDVVDSRSALAVVFLRMQRYFRSLDVDARSGSGAVSL